MIETIKLKKTYGSVTALHDVSFTAENGCITGLLGPNGAGKSTTLRALYGLIRLRTGSLLGMVIVQALQTMTVWHILLPQNPPAIAQLHYLYLATAILYLILIWRLWPKEEADYRV